MGGLGWYDVSVGIALIAVYPYSNRMLFAVVQTHRNGVRFSREEIRTATPVVGNLLLSDWLQGNASNRAIRIAKLMHATVEYHPTLLQPIFDPVLVRMSKIGFLLVGTERCLDGADCVESVQGWWCRAVIESSPDPVGNQR